MWDELADLFVEGTIEMDQCGVYVGKNRVSEFLNLLGDEGLKHGELNDHVQLQTIVDVAADGLTAKVRSRMMQQLGFFGRPSMGAAIYANEIVKEDGVWRFKSAHALNT